jgi:hypothetical protein
MIGAVALVSQANCDSIAQSIFPKNVLTIVNHHHFRVFEYSVGQVSLSFLGATNKNQRGNQNTNLFFHIEGN